MATNFRQNWQNYRHSAGLAYTTVHYRPSRDLSLYVCIRHVLKFDQTRNNHNISISEMVAVPNLVLKFIFFMTHRNQVTYMHQLTMFHQIKRFFYIGYCDFSIFQNGGRPPSWICIWQGLL